MNEKKAPFATVEEAVEEIRQGRMIVLVDDEDRENEGDLTMAADKVTPEAINFMAKYGRGLICLALTEQRCDALRPAADVRRSTHRLSARPSASRLTRGAGRPRASARPIAPPRFLPPSIRTRVRKIWRGRATCFTLRARNGGVLVRAGQTEASRRSCAHRGARSFRRDLRNHERRRHDGADCRS